MRRGVKKPLSPQRPVLRQAAMIKVHEHHDRDCNVLGRCSCTYFLPEKNKGIKTNPK